MSFDLNLPVSGISAVRVLPSDDPDTCMETRVTSVPEETGGPSHIVGATTRSAHDGKQVAPLRLSEAVADIPLMSNHPRRSYAWLDRFVEITRTDRDPYRLGLSLSVRYWCPIFPVIRIGLRSRPGAIQPPPKPEGLRSEKTTQYHRPIRQPMLSRLRIPVYDQVYAHWTGEQGYALVQQRLGVGRTDIPW